MEHYLKSRIEEIWSETIPYWNDDQSADYYNECIIVLIDYVEQLLQNNMNIELICNNAFSNYW